MTYFIELTGVDDTRILDRKTNIVSVAEEQKDATTIYTAHSNSYGKHDYLVKESYDDVKRLLGEDDKGGKSNG